MDLFEELESMTINVADNSEADTEPTERNSRDGKHHLDTPALKRLSMSRTRRATRFVTTCRATIGTCSGHRRRLKGSLVWHTNIGSRKVASQESLAVKRNLAILMCLQWSHPTLSDLKEFQIPQIKFKILPTCPNLRRQFKQLQRTETLSSVASLATSSNASKNGFHIRKSTFKPTFVRLSKAKKDLKQSSSPTSSDTTLSQHGGLVPNAPSRPVRQDDYPVWYFFYGTLADSDLLTRLLSLPEAEPPNLVPASISGGIIKLWNDKYKALVDAADNDYVRGSACEVASKEHEEALMLYETEKYEVVRCCITMANQTVQGLTFRFVEYM